MLGVGEGDERAVRREAVPAGDPHELPAAAELRRLLRADGGVDGEAITVRDRRGDRPVRLREPLVPARRNARQQRPGLAARERLEGEGLEVTVVDLYSMPFDAKALATLAHSCGGRVLTDTGPAHLLAEGGRVAGVRVAAADLTARAVVLAAGAGTRDLAAEVGVDLPVFPMPIGAGLLHGLPGLGTVPCTIDHAAEQWYRGEIGDALLIGAGYEDSIGFRGEPFHGKAEFAPPTLDQLVSAAAQLVPRIPALERASPGRTWVGLDSRTPDGHALAGPVPGVPGLFVLTGGNGKGFKFGPPMGQALVEVLLGADFARSPLAPFALDRYAEGRAIRGEHEYAWGPYGAKGLGETPIIAVAPAVTAAIHHAAGVRLHEIPATPERVWAALRSSEETSAGARA